MQKINFEDINLGYKKFLNGEIDEGKEILDSIFYSISDSRILEKREEENYLFLLKVLGEINRDLKNYNDALKYYTLLNEILENKDLDLLLNLAFCYKMLDNIEKSNFFYNKVRKIDKKFLEQRIGNTDFLDAEYQLNSQPNLADNYRVEKPSNRLYIYIYSICNFDCCFCDRGQQKYKTFYKGIDTSLKIVKEIIQNVDINEISRIAIGGNEPLTNINIDEILKYIDSLNKPIDLFTSGSEIDKMKSLLNYNNIEQVCFPIYSYSSKIHDKIVGRKGAYESIEKIKEIFSNTKIKIIQNKLLIKANFEDNKYLQEGLYSLLIPRDKALYMENSIKLTDIFSKVKDLKFDVYKSQIMPICVLYKALGTMQRNYLLEYIKEFYQIINNEREKANMSNYSIKLDKCIGCKMEKYCLGYYAYYFEKYGDNELDPNIFEKS